MNRFALCALAAFMMAACAGPRERIVLLPDKDGKVGAIDVRTKTGAVELREAYALARVEGTKTLAEKTDAAAVAERYGTVIDNLPARPQRFVLHFEFGSDRLTSQSRALMPGIQQDLKAFPAPELVVIGHTDAVGDPAFNDRLSLERANRVRDILAAAGVPRDQIQTAGRGAREPLVAARAGVPEPRNRRVEIKLR